MMRFVARKLGEALVVLVLVTLATQLLTDLIPGSPAALILGDTSNKDAVAKLNQEYGFDKPFFDRYWLWLRHAFHGQFGVSVQSNETVNHILLQRLPVTLEIATATIVLALLVSVPVAMFCAAREQSVVDRLVTLVSSVMFGVPTFVGSVILFELLANQTRLLPTFGWVALSANVGENIHHAILPVLISSLGVTALFTRVLRADLVTVLREDFVLSARAKGLPDRYILLRHALRPASRSLFTMTGLIFGFLLGGSVIVENYFSLPGVGQAVAQAVNGKDLPVVQGVVVLVALVFLVLNTLVDLGLILIDPQTRVRT
jgi:peptide/nickel transport system permease protein